MPIKKYVIDIKLAKAPLAMECNVEHSTNGDKIYHGTEILVKINNRLLVKAFNNKSSFIIKPSKFCLMRKNPFIAHYVLPRAQGNERPSVVPDERIILVLHGLNPLRILES